MKRLFNLIPSDVGRSLSDITTKISLGTILDEASKVLETLQACEGEVEADGKWFSMRIFPYRTMDNQIGGIVITFVDISPLKHAEQELERAKDFAENIVDTIREPLLILDTQLRVTSAGLSFYRFFRTTREETVGKYIYKLGNGQWDIPELRTLLEEILPQNSSFEDFDVEHEFPLIGPKKMRLNARRLAQANGELGLILLALEDVTRE